MTFSAIAHGGVTIASLFGMTIPTEGLVLKRLVDFFTVKVHWSTLMNDL